MIDFAGMAAAWQELAVFEELWSHPLSRLARDLVCEMGSEPPDPQRVARLQRDLAVPLVCWAQENPGLDHDDAWRQFLVEWIVSGENRFGRLASVMPLSKMSPALPALARPELSVLHTLYSLSSHELQTDLSLRGLEPGPSWDNGPPRTPPLPGDPATNLRARFHSAADWTTLLEPLAEYYYRNGIGVMGRQHAFRWDPREGLVGVPRPDPITLSELIGYEYQRKLLIDNTEQFLAGYPCNNILLYGARGTGKSSLVKALLNEYHDRGLRLVEVARDDLSDFPEIVRQLRGRPQRFLLFADDLSYDDGEMHYRDLKAALEGSVEGRPENVLLYATSNRRNLIKERFRDRESLDDEIHVHDTAQEKLSLSDRFGLTLSFAPPTQSEYFKMVDAIAVSRGLEIDPHELHAAAVRWAALHNTPSGRTARQFVDDLQGAALRAGNPAD